LTVDTHSNNPRFP